jgi:NADPH:quinone reductase-like Zn-dependent oxidoreductase
MVMQVVMLKKYDTDPVKALDLVQYAVPEPNKDEVLVEVYAASLNPIDARIRAGYGKTIFSLKAPLPIILGRDFSGVIVKVGEDVQEYKKGDSVFGVVSPFRALGMKQGSHAEFVCIPTSEITNKPTNVTHVQAASFPYVALTTYHALITQSGMRCEDYAGKQVFVSAGAGGVGSYAIQFLKALNAYVVTTCSEANVDYLNRLGADEVINYEKEDYTKRVRNCDIAYDLLGKSHTDSILPLLKSISLYKAIELQIETVLTSCLEMLAGADETWDVSKYKNILKYFDLELLKIFSYSSRYISIVGPMMPFTDSKGLHVGMRQFVSNTLERKFYQIKEHGRYFNYSFFEPNITGLKLLAEHISTDKVKSCVFQVFSLAQAAEAHKSIDSGHTRGKIVFYMNVNNNDSTLKNYVN